MMFIITFILPSIFFSKPFMRREKKKRYWLYVFKEKTETQVGIWGIWNIKQKLVF